MYDRSADNADWIDYFTKESVTWFNWYNAEPNGPNER